MNEIKIKKEEILTITTTDVIKVLLKTKKENGKNNVVLCDKEFGLRKDDDNIDFIIGKLAKRKVPEYKICNTYPAGKYWIISIDVFGYKNNTTNNIELLMKKIAYLYNKFYNAGYTKNIQNKRFNDWFKIIKDDYKNLNYAPNGYSVGMDFCYFTVNKREYINEVKNALLSAYCEFYKVEGWC